MRISVIIVTYNSAAHLRETLEALFAQRHASFEAILFDNASQDESLAIARTYEDRGLKIMENKTNLGFAGGNNEAVRGSRGEIVVLLNPDAVFDNEEMLGNIEKSLESDAGVVGAKLLVPGKDEIQHMGGVVGIPAHCSLYARGEKDGPNWSKPIEVEFVIGALFAVRRTLWDRLGGFDEFFNPAYYEDTDFCARVRAQGRAVICDPRVRLRHYENVSTEYKSPHFFWMHHKGRLWYTAKNLPLPTLIFRALPAELAWFLSPNARYHRRMLWGLYWMIFKRFLKRRIFHLAPLHV